MAQAADVDSSLFRVKLSAAWPAKVLFCSHCPCLRIRLTEEQLQQFYPVDLALRLVFFAHLSLRVIFHSSTGTKVILAGTVMQSGICLLHVSCDGDELELSVKSNNRLLNDAFLKHCVTVFRWHHVTRYWSIVWSVTLKHCFLPWHRCLSWTRVEKPQKDWRGRRARN